jgi:hypothetical protein
MAVGILGDACCSPVGLPNVSQAGLEPVCGSLVALLSSQCHLAWRSFVGVVVHGVKVLILLGDFFLPGVAPASQQDL